jgi:phosphoglycerate dehydrogenase-like enzyme
LLNIAEVLVAVNVISGAEVVGPVRVDVLAVEVHVPAHVKPVLSLVRGIDAHLHGQVVGLGDRFDFVCVECKYNSNTHKLIGKRELGLMKPEAYLINTGRGRIIDEPELIRALQEKRIAGAALDVYWNEPYMNDPPGTQESWVPEELCKLDNVILAPHNGNATWDTRGAKCVAVAKAMVQMMRGERPATLMNPEIYANA